MHILITGASGFVGQALVRMALAQGHAVTALVRPGSGLGTAAPAGAAALAHELGSGTPPAFPAGVDAVVHLAQSRAYRAFPGDAAEMFRVNVAGAQEVLLAAATAGVSRFCLVSTGSVYEPFTAPMVEDAALAPAGNLGATKLAAEVLSRPYGALFPVSVLRLFAPYGPGQTARLIPDLIRRVREGVAVTLPEDGGGMRLAPAYVDDVCAVILTALADAWRGAFNVAAPGSVTIEDAALTIGRALGRDPVFARQKMGAPVIVPDLTKLAATIDMARFRSFPDGIAATLAGEG